MRAWCEHCNKFIDCSDEYSRKDHLELNGICFSAIQSFGKCPVCGEEVQTNSMVDANIRRAHNAYRRALDSITPEEIKHILDKYDIGAQPLSLLLGWGANTIERQMKHTIPDREHANRLKSLNDPNEMLRLLNKGKDRIPAIAYKKAMNAVSNILYLDNSINYTSGNLHKLLYSLLLLNIQAGHYRSSGQYRKTYPASESFIKPIGKYVF